MALRIAAKEKVDLILLDIMMPEMDGYEVCRLLKKNSKTRSIPVVFYTSENDPEQERKGLIYGAIDFIRKPSNPLVLQAKVRNFVDLSKARKKLLEKKKTCTGQKGSRGC